tara:strand:- start:595 stop:1182 length:588 start_codon:yes stop_codon:yes gene_type:complete
MKIFIDCGANKGSDLDMFRINYEDYKSWRMVAFEPNPQCRDYMLLNDKLDNVELIEKAVWIEDSTKTFNIGSNTKSSTLRSDKTTNMSNKNITVETIDLSNYISQFNEEDYIILALDVEGAEYEVLEKMLIEKTIDLVDEIFVEFHTHKMKNSKEDNLQAREDKITEQLIENLGSDNVYIHEGHNAKKFKTLVKT